MSEYRNRGTNQWVLRQRRYMFNPHGGAGAPILERITLNSRKSVFCIVCEKCSLIYVGETGQTLSDWGNNCIALGKADWAPLWSNISKYTHQVISPPQGPVMWARTEGQRRRHESLWIGKLNTRTPLGLNVKDIKSCYLCLASHIWIKVIYVTWVMKIFWTFGYWTFLSGWLSLWVLRSKYHVLWPLFLISETWITSNRYIEGKHGFCVLKDKTVETVEPSMK